MHADTSMSKCLINFWRVSTSSWALCTLYSDETKCLKRLSFISFQSTIIDFEQHLCIDRSLNVLRNNIGYITGLKSIKKQVTIIWFYIVTNKKNLCWKFGLNIKKCIKSIRNVHSIDFFILTKHLPLQNFNPCYLWRFPFDWFSWQDVGWKLFITTNSS